MTLEIIISLLTLSALEIILGIDNIIFVSIVMGGLSAKNQQIARKVWMIAGIITRGLLLWLLGLLIHNPTKLHIFNYEFEVGNIVMLLGGLFLTYKAITEIHENMEGDEEEKENKATKKVHGVLSRAIFEIIAIDIVFSFDSMITAVGIGRNYYVMVFAITIAMFIMFKFSSVISKFIHTHPSIKMIALSFIVLVGFTLVFDGLEPIHRQIIPKSYIYVCMLFSFLVEVINMRVRKKAKKSVELHEPVDKSE
mgnify:FL=1